MIRPSPSADSSGPISFSTTPASRSGAVAAITIACNPPREVPMTTAFSTPRKSRNASESADSAAIL